MTYTGRQSNKVKIAEVDTGYDNNINDVVHLHVDDEDISSDSVILANQSGEPAEGKDEDENELDHFIVNATPSADGGSMHVIIRPMLGVTLSGKYKITYVIG